MSKELPSSLQSPVGSYSFGLSGSSSSGFGSFNTGRLFLVSREMLSALVGYYKGPPRLQKLGSGLFLVVYPCPNASATSFSSFQFGVLWLLKFLWTMLFSGVGPPE